MLDSTLKGNPNRTFCWGWKKWQLLLQAGNKVFPYFHISGPSIQSVHSFHWSSHWTCTMYNGGGSGGGRGRCAMASPAKRGSYVM